jgi:ferredoxin--NADP+ reductase
MPLYKETVTEVKHWSEKTFTFKTTRDPGFRFQNGEFTLLGIEHEGKKIMRAYSMASANYDEYIEWLSIKIQDGPLTSKLQHIKEGDTVLVNSKPTGTLVIDYVKPGRNLYLISTGTGLAPFLGIIKGLDTYEKFENVIVTHTVQQPNELVYKDYLENFNNNFSNVTQGKFKYFNTLTQTEWPNTGRITTWLFDSKLEPAIGLPKYDYTQDRMMICGSQGLNTDIMNWLESQGAQEGNTSTPGDFVVEKAFVQR